MRQTKEKLWRKRFVQAVGQCEFCGTNRIRLAIHEIARGIHRQKALTESSCILVLCDPCHSAIERMAGDDQRALGLALVLRSRPADYSLAEFHRLTDRNYPSSEAVTLWLRRLNFLGANDDQTQTRHGLLHRSG